MTDDNETLKRLVVFAIFLQNGEGILSKSPDYILEKYNTATVMENPENYLDSENRMKLQEYFLKWGI